jgi:hypothetical protein
VSCTQNSTACEELDIDSVPRLCYFCDGVIHSYTGMRIPRLLVNWVSGFVADTAAVGDAANYC